MAESDWAAMAVAIITGVFTGAISLFSLYFTQRHNQNLRDSEHRYQEELNSQNQKHENELAKLKQQLDIQRDEKAAIQNYMYSARQRLYNEFEPLLFIFVEHSDSALYRIQELALRAKDGNLEPETGWFNDYRGYFMTSTIYRLLLPLAVFKLLQRRLTIYDIDLVPLYKTQYLLAKQLFYTFSGDYDLAQSYPILDYDADAASEQDAINQPEIYRKQGIYVGLIEKMVEKLIVDEEKGSRLTSYSEFEEFLQGDTKELLNVFCDLFHNFHPRSRPVLWRILLTQAHLYLAIKNTRETKDSKSITKFKTLKILSSEDRLIFDWRRDDKEAANEDVLVKPFEAVENYLRRRLGDLMPEHLANT
jgi:hypothetical protein